jgi:glycerophosphoryl diester phosphodiesterase
MVIELKFYGHNDRLEERVIELVEEFGMADQIVTMSLNFAMVEKMKQLRPTWRAGLLTARSVGDLTGTNADFLAVNHAMANAALVKRAHVAGKEVFVWTINDAVNMSRMISRGVDGIITDYPARGRSVIADRRDMSPTERLLLAAAFYVGLSPREPAASVDTQG